MYSHMNDYAPRSPFPDMSISLLELVFFRSWQAPGIVRVIYYYALFLGFFSLVYNLVMWTLAAGAGGFFAGLIIGILSMLFMWLSARVFCELVLSVFQIRDYTVLNAGGSHGSSAISGNAISGNAISSSSNNNNTNTGSYQNAKVPPGGEAYSEL